MSLPEIKAFLLDNRLTFIGFEVESRIRDAYVLRFPSDAAAVNLDRWDEFERDNPDLFKSMYQFWLQKPAA